MKNLTAVKDKIIVKLLQPDNTTEGGIIIPDTAEKEPQAYGEVISVGEEITSIKAGDILLFAKFGGQDIMVDRVIYKVLIYGEVYCKLE